MTPSELLRLHRDGKVALSVLERFLQLAPFDQDDLLDELRRGESLEEFAIGIDRCEDITDAVLNRAIAWICFGEEIA